MAGKKTKEEDTERAPSKSAFAVLTCNCVHAFQDKQFGAGKRYHNRTKAGKARCTVCSNVKD